MFWRYLREMQHAIFPTYGEIDVEALVFDDIPFRDQSNRIR